MHVQVDLHLRDCRPVMDDVLGLRRRVAQMYPPPLACQCFVLPFQASVTLRVWGMMLPARANVKLPVYFTTRESQV